MNKLFGSFLVLSLINKISSDDEILVASAVKSVVRDFYTEQNDRFDLIICGEKSSEINNILDRFLRVRTGNIYPFNVIHVRVPRNIIRIDRSAILMFDNLESYRDFHQGVFLSNGFSKQMHILVYVKGVRESEASSLVLVKNFTEKPMMFQYESFLVHDDDGSLKILSFTMFHQPRCRDWIATEVNRFSSKTRQWKTKDFFIEKFSNFHGCDLVVLVVYPNEPAIQIDKSRKGENTSDAVFEGYAIDFNLELAHYLQFTLWFNSFGIIDMTESSKPLPEDYVIFVSSLRKMHSIENSEYFITEPFTTLDDVIIVSRFKPYSQFEKFILPFDMEVWHWLIATFVIAVTVIFLVRFARRSLKNFVFGTNVSSPMLNFL